MYLAKNLSGHSIRSTSFCALADALHRPMQREVIDAALEGHDVFLQAATSFGKSLCFQLPAVISHGSKSNIDGNLPDVRTNPGQSL